MLNVVAQTRGGGGDGGPDAEVRNETINTGLGVSGKVGQDRARVGQGRVN